MTCALKLPMQLFKLNISVLGNQSLLSCRLPTMKSMDMQSLHCCAALNEAVTARYRATRNRTLPLTYEMAKGPFRIGTEKSWNSWNTSNLLDGKRRSESAVDDIFIRRFITGTWHDLFVSEVIIKRQFNMIRIAGLVQRKVQPRKMYFLIGYTEELLSYWLKCPVKLELQTVATKEDAIYKYI